MTSFRLRELLLVSSSERKARKVRFHPTCTVVEGPNGTGKSSILKSIYWSFGAEPAVVSARWKGAAIQALVRFTVDESDYALLRMGDHYALFTDESGRPEVFSGVTNGVGPRLARLFDFTLTLTNQQGNHVTPPPAFLFLPFYVDQDHSWSRSWSGFSRLSQFPQWKTSVAEYHSGLRGRDYYELVGRLKAEKLDKELHCSERASLAFARDRVDEALPIASPSIPLSSFREEIDLILARLAEVTEIQQRYQTRMLDLQTQKSINDEQIRITEASLLEVGRDYEFATHRIRADSVSCPTCGAEYENSFAERFAIAKDEDRCRELLTELGHEHDRLQLSIGEAQRAHDEAAARVRELETLLATSRSEIRLLDVIRAEGRRELRGVLKAEIDSLTLRVHESELKVRATERQLRSLNDPALRGRLVAKYAEFLMAFLDELNVNEGRAEMAQNVAPSITQTGSALPRALLAYYFAFLHTMRVNPSATVCPIVIDSPNQQAQDAQNLAVMYAFLSQHQPDGTQLVLGVEDVLGVAFEGDRIQLSDTNGVLASDQYDDVLSELRPLLGRSLASQFGGPKP